MLGAIAGDIIGSVYEAVNVKTPLFYPLFDNLARPTDDTILTIAVAKWLLAPEGCRTAADLVDALKGHFQRYPRAGYGGSFVRWCLSSSRTGYNSWGNGSAMRVSPVGWAFTTLEETLDWARRSAEVTHNHPEGIKGAQATAAAIFLTRTGASKPALHEYIEKTFGYDLTRSLDMIRPTYEFDVSCQGSVPEAIIAFLESQGYEDAVRKAISLGGDSDTIACITGGIAAAAYGVPEEIRVEVMERLDDELIDVIREFERRYPAAR
jgi:ADP-ribosylglycohydrolase